MATLAMLRTDIVVPTASDVSNPRIVVRRVLLEYTLTLSVECLAKFNGA